MDKFIDVIITLAMVALFLFPSLLKGIKEANKKPAPSVSPEVDTDMPEVEEFLQKNASKIPKQEDYFTYETMDDNFENRTENKSWSVSDVSQQTDNKIDNEDLLTFEEDEVLKGVIYSEILKRKF